MIRVETYHKINNRNGPVVEHYPGTPADLRTLEAATRWAKKHLGTPGQKRHNRIDRDGRVILFPARSIWHSHCLTWERDST